MEMNFGVFLGMLFGYAVVFGIGFFWGMQKQKDKYNKAKEVVGKGVVVPDKTPDRPRPKDGQRPADMPKD